MADRVPSDHDSVHTVRAVLATAGSTRRPRVEIPADEADRFPADEVVRLVVDGTEYHARVETALTDDTRVVAGAYDSPRFARSPGDATNRLLEWIESADVSVGGSVLLDVIEDEFKYGVRQSGERVVYEATESPDDSLASIAEQLEGR
ncbi:hypothetical protein G9464_12170 [Halostella sp. JP-L12]|uniref:DUF7112 family protein n=1 Tax=Halostella TaxID=1843185 RepID=UPI000EF7F412|nr:MULTISPECIES: hypothetical protein [Halostella]NHN48348.1 hypothetical protein [Halostella sp. JP-L12]